MTGIPILTHLGTVPISRTAPMKHLGNLKRGDRSFEYEYIPVLQIAVIWRVQGGIRSEEVYTAALHQTVKRFYQERDRKYANAA